MDAIVTHHHAVVDLVAAQGGTAADVTETTAMLHDDGLIHLTSTVTDPYSGVEGLHATLTP